ncbi:MAG: exodeoxyribonuclease VII small subunit [Nitrospirota bacterium]
MAEEKFENSLKRLENIVAKMEKGELPLSESVKLFEEGIKLTRALTKQLEEAERKVEILLKDQSSGTKIEPFEPEEGE